MIFLAWLGDIFMLNLIYLVCCIPVITIGAATTALYYDALKLAENRDLYVWKDFLKSFRRNFRQATIIWLGILAFCAVLAADFFLMTGIGGRAVSAVMTAAVGSVGIVVALLIVYVFPVLARFDNTVKNTLKNALIMAVRHLPYTVVILGIHSIPLLAALASPWEFARYILPVFLLAGAVLPYLESKLFSRIFRNYYPKGEVTGKECK